MKAYLRIRKNAKCYYCILKWRANDVQYTKEVSTGIPIKGNNKRKAEKRCEELCSEYEQKYEHGQATVSTKEMLFSEYILEWLEGHKMNLRQSTYESYRQVITSSIEPYFKAKGIRVCDLEPRHIRTYYEYLLKRGLSANTIKHHHANITKALGDLVYEEVIPTNPASKVKLPKIDKYQASFYEADELQTLLTIAKGSPIELAINLGVLYGLRRSEICGLQWSAIDFQQGTIEIKSTVVRESTIIREDHTKSASSHRILPILAPIAKLLNQIKEQQSADQLLLGNAYDANDYVLKWGDGRPFNPDYLSRAFKRLLTSNHLRIIRFHDLRHSCASLLISLGYDMKVIQIIMGHSDYNTTANIYGHLTKKMELTALDSVVNTLF